MSTPRPWGGWFQFLTSLALASASYGKSGRAMPSMCPVGNTVTILSVVRVACGTCTWPRPNQARSLALAGDDQVTVVMTYANKADWLKIMHMCPQYWRITGWRGPCMVHPWGPAIGGVRRATGPPPLDPRVEHWVSAKERWERHKHWWVDHRCGTSTLKCAHPRRRRCVVIASVLNKRKYAD